MLRSTSILLVGDEPEASRLRRRLCRHFLGAEVARTIDESRELARRCRFHVLVLVDPTQPWQELRCALEDFAELPSEALVITGKPGAKLEVDELLGGSAEVLLRPFSTDELVAALDTICARATSGPQPDARGPASTRYPLDWTLEQVKHHHMTLVLEDCNGNKSEAARRLGISRRTLDRKIGVAGDE